MHAATYERITRCIDEANVISDLEERGRRLRLVAKLHNEGCVIRALESAMETPAQFRELEMRGKDLSLYRKDISFIPSFSDPEKNAIRSGILERIDDGLVRSLISRMIDSGSPLGLALGAHTYVEEEYDFGRVRETLENNGILLLKLRLPTLRHLTHVKLVHGQILQVSDDDSILSPDTQIIFPGMLFTPNSQSAV